MVQVVYLVQNPPLHESTHLTLGLVIIYLVALAGNKKRWALTAALLVMALVATTYVHLSYTDLEWRQGFPTRLDTVVGVMLIIVVFDATRRTMGWAIPLLSLFFIGYAFFGNHFPSPFNTPKLDLVEIVAVSTTNLTGIYGRLLGVSAVFIFLFVVLGGIIQVTAASRFFNIVGNLAARTVRGGPAMSAVVTSALLGSTIGSISANIAVTGAFTIPLMKKMGYRPHEAAAIESAASNGGQIMPPVMGSVAFIMAEFTGIPYFAIAIASFIPALLYFASAGLYVQLTAMKRNLQPVREPFGRAEVKQLLVTAPAFLGPLTVIVLLFVNGFSPMFVAFWAVISSIVLGLILPGKKPSLREWIGAITKGAQTGATIAISLAAVGVVVEMLIQTGLAIKLPGLVEAWSQGNLAIALILVAISALILGMGMPTAPAYIIVAIAAAPVLVRMGLPLLPAHLFVLYFATISLITPPVGPGVLVACRLAGSGYLRTGFEATKVAVVAFLVPFIFVSSPIFILQPGGSFMWSLTTIVAGLVMVLGAQVGFVNHFLVSLHPAERALSLVSAISLFVYIVVLPSYLVLMAGLALFAVLTFIQLRKRQSARLEPPMVIA